MDRRTRQEVCPPLECRPGDFKVMASARQDVVARAAAAAHRRAAGARAARKVSRLPISPFGAVQRPKTRMSTADINLLALRGELLTRFLVSYYLPYL